MKLYFDLLSTILASAHTDGVIPANPCGPIKVNAAFRGLSGTPRWIPTEAQVLDLLDMVPERYHAALWLGAGQGCRIGEVLAMEDSPHCLDLNRGELHVVQQLQYDNPEHGGFYLKEPKSGSVGTITLDTHVRQVVAHHLRTFGSTAVELVDATTDRPHPRVAKLLFVDSRQRPFHDRRWSEHWTRWRDAAGWPVRHGTFHALRHFCATTMLTNGVDPQHVQRTLRHGSLPFTLRTYVQWLPHHQRPTNVVSTALHQARRLRQSWSRSS
ncbi:tyrosine-type recombinase/integrase [Virgisporangium aliadipatigenens]|nr:site-specific integrase [Virgisporangium aliadipatigenens]